MAPAPILVVVVVLGGGIDASSTVSLSTLGPGSAGFFRWTACSGPSLVTDRRGVTSLPLFADRSDAGRRLAERLLHLRGPDTVVVGLMRGGVPVAFEVATRLHAPLGVVLVRKLDLPLRFHLPVGAIAEDGVRVLDENVVRSAHLPLEELEQAERRERQELDRLARRFRHGRMPTQLGGRSVIVVDDGIVTGSTARAACQVVRQHGARRIYLAVPVAPGHWADRLRGIADEFVALSTSPTLDDVDQCYTDFEPTTDAEIISCLDLGARPDRGSQEPPDG